MKRLQDGAPACCRLRSFARSKPATCRRSVLDSSLLSTELFSARTDLLRVSRSVWSAAYSAAFEGAGMPRTPNASRSWVAALPRCEMSGLTALFECIINPQSIDPRGTALEAAGDVDTTAAGIWSPDDTLSRLRGSPQRCWRTVPSSNLRAVVHRGRSCGRLSARRLQRGRAEANPHAICGPYTGELHEDDPSAAGARAL